VYVLETIWHGAVSDLIIMLKDAFYCHRCWRMVDSGVICHQGISLEIT
jgi:hypothetical protein